MPPIPTFTQRLKNRERRWWGPPWREFRGSLHRALDRVRLRSHRTPLDEWRCCELWQRCLLNKWNSREFAVLHGLRVPDLHWAGRDAARMPIGEFPDQFVIRPSWGAGTHGTYLVSGNRDVATGEVYRDRQAIKASVIRGRGRLSVFPLLVEEYLKSTEGENGNAREYKFFMFQGHVGSIMTFERRGGAKYLRHYTPEWEPIDEVFQAAYPLDDPRPRPHDLGEMTRIARMLGAAVGTFMRVDLYSTSRGIVFGEFSSVPGIRGGFTPFADDYLGRLWQEHVPDRV